MSKSKQKSLAQNSADFSFLVDFFHVYRFFGGSESTNRRENNESKINETEREKEHWKSISFLFSLIDIPFS